MEPSDSEEQRHLSVAFHHFFPTVFVFSLPVNGEPGIGYTNAIDDLKPHANQ